MDIEKIYAGSEYSFELYQNADCSFELTWFDGDGVGVDLTGKSARMQFKLQNSEAVAFEISSATGGIVLTNPGIITLNFPHTLTATVAAGTYLTDLHVWDATHSDYLFYGRVLVRKRVTS